MDLLRGKLCSQCSTMEELKNVLSRIHVTCKFTTEYNTMKEHRVTELHHLLERLSLSHFYLGYIHKMKC